MWRKWEAPGSFTKASDPGCGHLAALQPYPGLDHHGHPARLHIQSVVHVGRSPAPMFGAVPASLRSHGALETRAAS